MVKESNLKWLEVVNVLILEQLVKLKKKNKKEKKKLKLEKKREKLKDLVKIHNKSQ